MPAPSENGDSISGERSQPPSRGFRQPPQDAGAEKKANPPHPARKFIDPSAHANTPDDGEKHISFPDDMKEPPADVPVPALKGATAWESFKSMATFLQVCLLQVC
eukprot:3521183-Rhodomonas_salina.1